MKKILKVLLVLLLSTSLFACNKPNTNNNKIKIVTTIFPIYDWTNHIINGSENIELYFLLNSGVDLHNYQASAQDIITIGSADLFIYVGGESDTWVDDALKEATNKNMITLNLMDLSDDIALTEEEKEGMQEEDEDHEHEEEYDEHVYLSLKNAEYYINAIKEEILKLDNTNDDLYNRNAFDYISELQQLDSEYSRVINHSKHNVLMFADRFPFRYLVEDYNLDYYAAFKGCSAETEASFETIAFLTEKLNELDINHLLVLESSNQKLAKTIINNSNKKDTQIEIIDSMQSTTLNDNTTYLDIMKNNLEVLKKVLN